MNARVEGHYRELKKALAAQPDLEAKLLELRRYKKQQVREWESELLAQNLGLESVMSQLTDLADAVLVATLDMARDELSQTYGLPRCKDNDGNYLNSELAVIGMGKLGGAELHFYSDLDLIFIYSRNGETQGRKPISNREYFAKLVQRLISYLTLPTREGSVYKIDTELRPSGNAGALVTALDSWITYYHEHAAHWERQALLKARLIHAGGNFNAAFRGLFRRLIFIKPFPENLAEEIHHLRMRIEKELAKEGPRRWHFKKGMGGVVDIEFTVQFLQMKLGKIFENLVTPNTLTALDRFEQRGILSKEEIRTLREAYVFYRTLEIVLEAEFDLKEGYLDLEHERLEELADKLSLPNKDNLVGIFGRHRRKVREIYLKALKISKG
jgi:[glutamine synthetase] adenylyltransferase / [glutamine synthetase]-adenylyl-L-tyrosine phosphorylase